MLDLLPMRLSLGNANKSRNNPSVYIFWGSFYRFQPVPHRYLIKYISLAVFNFCIILISEVTLILSIRTNWNVLHLNFFGEELRRKKSLRSSSYSIPEVSQRTLSHVVSEMIYFTVVCLKFFFIVLFLSIESMKKRRPTVVFHLWVINRNQPNGGDNYLSFVSIKIKFKAFRSYGSWKLYLIEVKKKLFWTAC